MTPLNTSDKVELIELKPDNEPVLIDFILSHISAGFPSPSDDYIEAKLDLNEYLMQNSSSTFILRVSGDSMIGAGIHSNDLLIVDRSLEATNKKIVIAVLNGDLTVKRIRINRRTKQVRLIAENAQYPDILITEEMNFRIWGVVTSVIHKF